MLQLCALLLRCIDALLSLNYASCLQGAPNDEKDLSLVRHELLKLTAAVCKMQGWRRNQEDMGVALCGLPGAPEPLMCGVFDGHSGDVSSTYAAAQVWPAVVKSKHWANGSVEEALIQGFLEVDSGLRAMGSKDGTTAVCALVTAQHLWVANCGDSRAVLCRGGSAVPMSVDHKPDLQEETERIRRAGGFVDRFDPRCPRVMAPGCYMAMATSRTLGDFHFKTNTNRCVTALLKAGHHYSHT
jgi:serine/threonine protein phosphatase PrpC